MRFAIYPELPAADLNRAARWYREKLGLEPVRCGGEPVTGGTTEFDSELLYDTGEGKFGIYESWTAGRNEATAARIVVSDFDKAIATMRKAGVSFEDYDYGEEFRTVDGVLVSPDGEKTAWFKDSEGNVLAIGSS